MNYEYMINYLIAGILVGYVGARFWDWFVYSSAAESIWNFFYDIFHKE